MTFFPDSKTFLQIGSLSIAWYAILIITGAFIAYKIGQHNFKRWVTIKIFYLIIFLDY